MIIKAGFSLVDTVVLLLVPLVVNIVVVVTGCVVEVFDTVSVGRQSIED
jgi:hypothetical protein